MTTTGRLMIVEDELLIAEHLRSSLSAMGHQIVGIAANCEEAMVLAEAKPELALLDIRIQGARDGIDTAALLQQQRGIAVLFITAHTDRDTLERAKELEPLGYLVKPFSDRSLGVSVECALHHHRLEERRCQQLKALAAAVARQRDCVFFTDERGTVQSANDATLRYLGCEAGTTLVGRNLVDILPLTPLALEQLRTWVNEASNHTFVSALANPGGVLEAIRVPSEPHQPIILATVRTDSPWPLETREQVWNGKRTATGEPLVTVCAMCRRAQDTSETFVPVDSYLALRFGLAFSHTLCPSCLGEVGPRPNV
jgi:AmiR/NasT family two-component response regulator